MLVTEKSVPLHRFNEAIDCLTKNLQTKMKKLVFLFVACAAMSFAVSFSSCGGSTEVANDSADSADSVDSVAKVADSVANAEAQPEANDSVDSTDSVVAE
ncbi:MAG: hypothetical protein ACI4UC_01355 [Alloprevotella sp.]